MVAAQVIKAIASYDLETKVVGLPVDSTNTKFGGLPRLSDEDVLTKIEYLLNRNIISFGFNAHIIHTCVKTALDSVPVDSEVFVRKIFGYIHIYNVPVERVKFL